MQTRNLLLFFAVTLLLFVGYFQVRQRFWPAPADQPASKEEEARKKEQARKEEQAKKKDKGKEEARGKDGRKPPQGEFRLPPEPEVTPAGELVRLGERDGGSKFHIAATLDPLGEGCGSCKTFSANSL